MGTRDTGLSFGDEVEVLDWESRNLGTSLSSLTLAVQCCWSHLPSLGLPLEAFTAHGF